MSKKKFIIILILMIIVQGCSIEEYDRNSSNYDLSYVLNASGINTSDYVKNLTEAIQNVTDLEVFGDYNLIVGRLTHDKEKISLALDFYSKALEDAKTWQEKALLYETIASIDNSKYHYARAAYAWKRAGNKFRAKMDLYFALGRRPGWVYSFNTSQSTAIKPSVNKGDKIVYQADKVVRDWLSYQLQSPYSENLLKTFSERLSGSKEDVLQDIGWRESGRVTELKQLGLEHEVATGTILKKYKGKWYAPNEKGVFMFEVPVDKVLYPTTRFLREDVALVIDTHGVNMVVSQALKNNASLVIACCDKSSGSIVYLKDKGVDVFCMDEQCG